jgi:hypothetical protein
MFDYMIENINFKIAMELNEFMYKYYNQIEYKQIIKLIKVQMKILEMAAKENDKDAQHQLAPLYVESAFFFMRTHFLTKTSMFFG